MQHPSPPVGFLFQESPRGSRESRELGFFLVWRVESSYFDVFSKEACHHFSAESFSLERVGFKNCYRSLCAKVSMLENERDSFMTFFHSLFLVYPHSLD